MTAPDSSPRYRKLPGRRGGLISSASLWTAADHLLSVKSDRFREHYKRFYFRDIQAIVVTQVPRFPVSARVVFLGILLFTALGFARLRAPGLATGVWLLAAGLAACWIYISAAHSCTCRLYTAVSREELPSVYRMWTARKVLAELEPHIAQTQGVFAESWAEAVDQFTLGPPAVSGQSTIRTRPSRTLASDLFLASLFADALATGLQMGSPKPLLTAISASLTVIQVAAAIWIFVQHQRGALSTAMQRLAIVTLVFIGGVTYAQSIAEAVKAGMAGRRASGTFNVFGYSETTLAIYIVGMLALGLTGVVLSFKSFEPESPPAITG